MGDLEPAGNWRRRAPRHRAAGSGATSYADSRPTRVHAPGSGGGGSSRVPLAAEDEGRRVEQVRVREARQALEREGVPGSCGGAPPVLDGRRLRWGGSRGDGRGDRRRLQEAAKGAAGRLRWLGRRRPAAGRLPRRGRAPVAGEAATRGGGGLPRLGRRRTARRGRAPSDLRRLPVAPAARGGGEGRGFPWLGTRLREANDAGGGGGRAGGEGGGRAGDRFC